jgi:hypothetical protein
MHPQVRRLAAPAVAVLILLITFVALFTAAFQDPKPNGLAVAVAGPPGVERELQARVDRAGVGIEFERVASPAAARHEVLEQDAQGALLMEPTGPRLLVASAGSFMQAQALEAGVSRAAAAGGAQVTVEDVKPLPEHDSRGLSTVFLAVGVTVPSFLLGALLWAVGGAAPARVVTGVLLAFAATTGLVAAFTVDTVIGALDGAFWQIAGIVALLTVAVAASVAGLGRLAGPPGVALAALVVLLLSLSSSGGPVGHLMLPDFYKAISQLLPTGTAMTSIRDTVYFAGEQALVPILVLSAWATGGIAALFLGRNRGPGHAH